MWTCCRGYPVNGMKCCWPPKPNDAVALLASLSHQPYTLILSSLEAVTVSRFECTFSGETMSYLCLFPDIYVYICMYELRGKTRMSITILFFYNFVAPVVVALRIRCKSISCKRPELKCWKNVYVRAPGGEYSTPVEVRALEETDVECVASWAFKSIISLVWR